MISAVVAFGWANSPFAEHYLAIFETKFRIGIGDFTLEKPLTLWINDG